MDTVNFRMRKFKGYRLFSQKFTFLYWFYSLVVSYYIYYLEKPFSQWHCFALVITKTVTPHVPYHEQCDDLGCKVQYSTNNKFYPYLQIECSQGLTILRYGVKSWQAHQSFLYLLFYDKPWH